MAPEDYKNIIFPVRKKDPHQGRCLFCGADLRHTFVDLGMSPLAQSYLKPEQLNQMEPFYPLHVYVCSKCFLVQVEEYVGAKDIFTEYAYFSSYSDSWLQHCRKYVNDITERLKLNDKSFVVEVGSNDGYLLQYFVREKIPCLGIEPAANIAEVAVKKGVPTIVKFFGTEAAKEIVSKGKRADLICGANVMAQVPELNDFVEGLKILLKPQGVITIEFPYLIKLIEGNQFDTIYHEHHSYFALISCEKIFASYGLTIFDVDEIPTHGGSLRIYARHMGDKSKPVSENVTNLRAREERAGLNTLEYYSSFSEKVKEKKRQILDFLINIKREEKSIVNYGAPAKGNTFLNYAGIRTDFIDYAVDRNPYKQGKFLPGTHIPIFPPKKIKETKPDYLLIMPWNLKEEIMEQMSYIRKWGGKFLVLIPEAKVYD